MNDLLTAPDRYCFTLPNGGCVSQHPKCMHQVHPHSSDCECDACMKQDRVFDQMRFNRGVNQPATNTAVLEAAGYQIKPSTHVPRAYVQSPTGWRLPPCDCDECKGVTLGR